MILYFCTRNGGLAQLARALAWHARGHRFDSDILHKKRLKPCKQIIYKAFFCRIAEPFLHIKDTVIIINQSQPKSGKDPQPPTPNT